MSAQGARSLGRAALTFLASAALAALAACGPRSEAAPQSEQPAASAGAPGTVTVDDKMRAAITVATVTARESAGQLSLAGRVQFDEDRIARVLAPVAGQVVDLHVKVGDRVSKGQVLCAIASRDAASAVAEYVESQKDLELAEKTATMTEDLYQHEAASRIALQQAQNDLAKARSRVARTTEALRVLGLRADGTGARSDGRVPILAPIAGAVIERKVTEGQFEQADATPMITVADASVVWVVGDVFERDLHLVSIGQSVSITATAYPGETFRGRIDYISDSIDPATRSAKIRVSVPNPGGRLKPEMFAAIAVDVVARGESQAVTTIPASAVFVEDGRSYVYAEIGARTFARRVIQVSPAEGSGDSVRRVLDGLKAGDRIVVSGALLLRQQEDKRAG
ncbi:MAG TPA: efflux RND transporter periplasmic adaptor subunit [Vicinamibacterales bacterium]|nr:efflux RND transporter periplasmic adaptor subunit [Vicinamibacterales bacterium]